MFKEACFEPEFFDRFYENVGGESAFQDAGVASVLEELVGVCHNFSWYSTNGIKNVIVTHQGTRPCNPFGDIIFTFLISRILRKIKRTLHDTGFVLPDFV
jgi:hypothetical protein